MSGGAINLANTAPLRLGRLTVTPATRQADWPEGSLTLEPRVVLVLAALADRRGQVVSRDELIERCWNGVIVGDNAMHRAISHLRRLAETVGEPSFHIDTIARVGYRLMTETEGESEVAAPAPAPIARTPRPRWRIGPVEIGIVGAIGLAAVLALVAVLFARPARPPIERVVIGPMLAVEGEVELGRAAGALSEAIARHLAKVGVPTETASPGAHPADALTVTGAVERTPAGYALTLRILDPHSGSTLWSDRFSDSGDGLDAMVSRAARVAAATMDCAIDDLKLMRPQPTQATLGLYLNTCSAVFSGPGPARMLMLSRRLVDVDPNNAPAHAMHAIAAGLAAGASPSPSEEASLQKEAQDAAAAALKLNPKVAKAYVGLALSRPTLGAWAAMEGDLGRALAIDPDLPPARKILGDVLSAVGRQKDAVALVSANGDRQDPRLMGTAPAAMMAAAMGDRATAEALLQRLERQAPGASTGLRREIAFWWDPPAEARRTLGAGDPNGAPPAPVSMSGEGGSSACALLYLRQRAGNWPVTGLPDICLQEPPAWRTRLLAREGDLDGAYAAFDETLAARADIAFLYNPEMAAFRADPRFVPLAERLGLIAYWKTSHHPPDFCLTPNQTAADKPPVCAGLG